MEAVRNKSILSKQKTLIYHLNSNFCIHAPSKCLLMPPPRQTLGQAYESFPANIMLKATFALDRNEFQAWTIIYANIHRKSVSSENATNGSGAEGERCANTVPEWGKTMPLKNCCTPSQFHLGALTKERNEVICLFHSNTRSKMWPLFAICRYLYGFVPIIFAWHFLKDPKLCFYISWKWVHVSIFFVLLL